MFPIGMAPIKRKLCLAKALLMAGIDCRVLVFAGHNNSLRNEKNHSNDDSFEGVPFTIIGKDTNGETGFVSKVKAICSFFELLIFLKRELMPDDVVYTYVHDKFTLWYMNQVIRVVHSKRAKYVRELCELPFGKGNETKVAVVNRRRILEQQFKKYDGILSISQNLTELAKQYTRTECKIFQLPILVEYEKYALEDLSDMAEVPYIFHSGSLTEQKDGILGMIEAFGIATKLLDFPIRFISTGKKEDSAFSIQIDKLVKKYSLDDKLLFTGFVSDDVLKNYLQQASIVIINKYPTQQNHYCFSTKLGEYMAAGKPVIITNVGEAMNWLTDHKDALVVKSQDTKAMSNAIVELFADSNQRIRLGNNARITCQHAFDYRVYASPLKDFFSKL